MGSRRGRKDGVAKMLPNLSAILAPFVNVRTPFWLLFATAFSKKRRRVSRSIVSELFLEATMLQRKTVGLPSNIAGLEEILSPSLSQVGWTINISTFFIRVYQSINQSIHLCVIMLLS